MCKWENLINSPILFKFLIFPQIFNAVFFFIGIFIEYRSMNIPEIYLIEPYNAYAPKGRKKHWHEIVEEQALMARIIAEQQALQEAQSRTLPPNSPDISSATVGSPGGGGGGGVPVYPFFNPSTDVIDFSFTPTNGAAPITVVFTNTTTTPQFDSYVWRFSDTSTTSSLADPTHVFPTGSDDPTYFTASLEVTNSVTGIGGGKTVHYVTVSVPVVTSRFTFTTSSTVAPITASFTNTSTNTSQTPTIDGKFPLEILPLYLRLQM
jgi:hypothetical protein